MIETTNKTLRFVHLGNQPSYQKVWDLQKNLQRQRIEQKIPDTLLFVEHQPVYTIGKNGSENHVIASQQQLSDEHIDVVQVDRGGDVTYHGPGQLVGYPIFDLKQHEKSISWYMRTLEAVILDVLDYYGIEGRREEEFTGVWVKDEKLMALGVRIARWVTMHGFAFNVNPQLAHFNGIIPCGIFHKGVTSLEQLLKEKQDMAEVGKIVLQSFQKIFIFSDTIYADWREENGQILIEEAVAVSAVSNESRLAAPHNG